MNIKLCVRAFALAVVVAAVPAARADHQGYSGPSSSNSAWPQGGNSQSSGSGSMLDPSTLLGGTSSSNDLASSVLGSAGMGSGSGSTTNILLQTVGSASSLFSATIDGSSASFERPDCHCQPKLVPEPTSLVILALSITLVGGLHMRRRMLCNPIV